MKPIRALGQEAASKPFMALEAIQHQGRSALFIEINAIVKKVKEMPQASVKPNALEKLGISEVIARRTGIKTRVNISKDPGPNAWIEPPYIDANHALLDDLRRESFWALDHIERENGKVFGFSESLTGTVDLKNSKVTGDFANILCPMEVTYDLLFHKEATPEMATTAILHEIGHPFTYFEFYGHMTTFNGALYAAVQQFVGANSREDRLKIIQMTDQKLGVQTEDSQSLADTKDGTTFILTYARTFLLDRKSSLGSSVYDITLWESLADQFAMRHGAGVDAIKLDELFNKSVFNSSYQSRLTHMVVTLFKSLLWFALVAGPLAFGAIIPAILVPLVMMLFIDPTKRIYDEPRARMDRMYRDMVASLRAPNISKEEKARIGEDIKVAKDILAQFDDKRGLIELFYSSILPSGRNQRSQRLFQLEMEKLANNELFVAGNSLATLLK